MRILVTGGLGNLGTWIVENLVSQGHEVTTLSSKDRDVLRNLNFKRVFADVSNPIEVAKSLKEFSFDAIVHLASVNEGNIPGYARIALDTNAYGTRVILDWACRQIIKPHFIYFSTFHVYGLGAGNISEETKPQPKHDYGTTHLFAEMYVEQFARAQQLPYTIFRLTNSYGAPKEVGSSKWYLVLNDLARMVCTEGKIELQSNGKPLRDFIWMGDVVKVVGHFLNKGAKNAIYNLGSGTSITMFQVAEMVQQAWFKHTKELVKIQVNESDESSPAFLQVECAKLWAEVGDSPSNKMEEEATAIFKLLGK